MNQAVFAVIPSHLAADEVKALRDWLTRGKIALLVLTDAQMGSALVALTELPEIQVVEAGEIMRCSARLTSRIRCSPRLPIPASAIFRTSILESSARGISGNRQGSRAG